MSNPSRGHSLWMFIPAIVLTLGYVIVFLVPNVRFGKELENDLAGVRAVEPTREQMLDQRAKLAAVQKLLADSQVDEKAWLQRWDSIAGSNLAAIARPDRVTQLLALLSKQGIHVVENGPFEPHELRLSSSHERLLKLFAERKSAPQPWRLKIAGRYGDVERALRTMSSGQPVAIPLGLMMKEAIHPTAMHEWVMVVWI